MGNTESSESSVNSRCNVTHVLSFIIVIFVSLAGPVAIASEIEDEVGQATISSSREAVDYVARLDTQRYVLSSLTHYPSKLLQRIATQSSQNICKV